MRALLGLAGIAAVIGCSMVAAVGLENGEKRSGFDFMTPETQALQADDTSNPGMLWVLQGEQLWQQLEGRANTACAGCHGDAARTMRGVAARYPAFDEATRRPIDLAGRINSCRVSRQQAEPLAPESDELLALTTYVARQSRGMPPMPGSRRSATMAGACSRAASANSISPAPLVTTTIGAGGWAAASSRRRIRTATRSTDWSGRGSARCSAACATA
jgi:hypothetical protein